MFRFPVYQFIKSPPLSNSTHTDATTDLATQDSNATPAGCKYARLARLQNL
jgi:hypothetical protein